ncbi:MAG: prephenate dehydrogenase [Actinobacteria bacterium]|uniref:Prephenate dehydrogenase n=1 Tax=freshwater metagenome TaxID=449393 RepID=A0A6J5ZI74_9ZZZZ|nr:prephenate dehydrogenase [Actinomycetota bacterium]
MTTHVKPAQSILVIGTGLIGTSIAMGLKAAGHIVYLSDVDAAAQETAVRKSAGLAWQADDKSISIDVVFVATPPSAAAAVMSQAAKQHLAAIVSDVSSVKSSVFSSLADVDATQLARIVGGHPMAGREVAGARAAQSNLFVDRPWVITRNDHTTDNAVAVIKDLVTQLGAVPLERSAQDHDRAVALVSHAPQIVASVLAGQLQHALDSDVALAGQGVRDTTRIASSDSALWSQILLGNAKEVASQISQISMRLDQVAKALQTGSNVVVLQALTDGVAGRDRLPGKHGAAKTDSALVEVRLEDKPGELARLFAAAAAADVNLEDVRIDHSLGRMTGLVELTVSTAKAQALESALELAEFVVVN